MTAIVSTNAFYDSCLSKFFPDFVTQKNMHFITC